MIATVSSLLIVALLAAALLCAAPALAASRSKCRPARPGLWEIRMSEAGSKAAGMTMQQCTDEATDKEMTSTFSPTAKEVCSKQDMQKTATGYVADAVCTVDGVDHDLACRHHRRFQFRLYGQGHLAQRRRASGRPRDSTMTMRPNGSAPARPDQKAGDIVMPGGLKMNIKDMQKLKAMMPKQ